MRVLIILIIFIGGCASTSRTGAVAQDNKDVVILSILVQDHLRKTKNERSINLAELLEKDTLNRISKNFKTIELKSKGAYISVYYKFSEARDSKGIVLSNKETERKRYFRWKEKDLKSQYDGEIRFDYGERFYRLIKIIVNKRSN